jgi:hypothetical protein
MPARIYVDECSGKDVPHTPLCRGGIFPYASSDAIMRQSGNQPSAKGAFYMLKNKTAVHEFINENDVKFIRLSFCDVSASRRTFPSCPRS